MKNVKFKFDNRDMVTVTGYNNPQDAFYAANEFLVKIEDEEVEYYAVGQHKDFKDDGSIDFMVKAYNKI
jgi:hypothetical protein